MSREGESALADEAAEVTVLESERVFAGKVWDIRRESFALDDAVVVREFMDHTGAVAVLALDEQDRVLLLQQYRHPVRMRDWELPAGLLDLEGESPLTAAQRELAEEADLEADEWSVLTDMLTSPGGSNEVIRIYLARGVRASGQVFERSEEEAGIVLRWVDLDAALDAVLDRRLQNAILCQAVLVAAAARDRGWSSLAPGDADWPQLTARR